jgi:hypothetical protein
MDFVLGCAHRRNMRPESALFQPVADRQRPI